MTDNTARTQHIWELEVRNMLDMLADGPLEPWEKTAPPAAAVERIPNGFVNLAPAPAAPRFVVPWWRKLDVEMRLDSIWFPRGTPEYELLIADPPLDVGRGLLFRVRHWEQAGVRVWMSDAQVEEMYRVLRR